MDPKLVESLRQLRKICKDISENWDTVLELGYPFNISFDEVSADIDDWVETHLDERR